MVRSLMAALLLAALAASVACGGGDDDDSDNETAEASTSVERGSATPRPTSDAELITPEGTAATAETPAPVADTPAPAAPTSPPAPPTAAPAPTEAPPPPPPAATTLAIVAEGIAFTQLATTAPAGDVTIVFDNRAAGIPHNVHFFAGPAATSASLAMTSIAPGAVQQTLPLGALAAGAYFYRCDVHPAQMNGTLTVS